MDAIGKRRCRVCTRHNLQLVPFAGAGAGSQQKLPCALSEAIATIGAVQVEEGDELPQHCCVHCLRRLQEAYQLRQICQKADRMLREMFLPEEDEMVEVYVKVEEEDDSESEAEILCEEEILEPETAEAAVIKEEIDDFEYVAYELPIGEEIKEQQEQAAVFIKEETDDSQVNLVNDDAQSPGPVEEVRIKEEVEEPQLSILKEEIDIVDDGDGYFDDESNDMDVDDNAGGGEDEEIPYETLKTDEFRCCGCTQKFETLAELLAHSKTNHIGKKLTEEEMRTKVQCYICWKTIMHSSYASHRRQKKFDYRCKTCGDSFANKFQAQKHFLMKHKLKVAGSITCCGCAQSFASTEELTAHSETVHLPKRPPKADKWPFVCEICYGCFRSENGMYRHQKKLTQDGQKFRCMECGKYFMYLSKLRDHEKMHAQTLLMTKTITKCKVAEPDQQSMLQNIESHKMPNNRLKCLICEKSFRSAEYLRLHFLSHTEESPARPFRCPHCPTAFVHAYRLAEHIETHAEIQKDFHCKHCDEKFSSVSTLERHCRLRHGNNRPFKCLYCDSSFQWKHKMKSHVYRMHAAELHADPRPEDELFG